MELFLSRYLPTRCYS